MEKRNLTPLRNVLVRYLAVCGGGSLVILLVWWGLFMSLIRNGFLLPPVTGAQVCSEARDYAATATVETFDPNAIDPLCRYAILQAGTAHVLQTNMTAGQLKKEVRGNDTEGILRRDRFGRCTGHGAIGRRAHGLAVHPALRVGWQL